MTDFADLASARETELRDDALAAHRRLARAGRPTADWPALTDAVGDDERRCAICDDSIPAARRRAVPGCDTCIDCQEALERALAAAAAPPRRRKFPA